MYHSLARKSVRQSTSEHTRKTNLRLQERQDAPRRRRGAHRDRPLTQEELLAEAKITEELNIRSLGENMLFMLFKLIKYKDIWSQNVLSCVQYFCSILSVYIVCVCDDSNKHV